MKNEALSEPTRFKSPTCEVCQQKPAVCFSFFFRDLNQGQDGAWKLCCDCTAGTEDYYILFDDFFSKETDWLAHLGEKRWMDRDDWQAMMRRFSGEAEIESPIREDQCQCGESLARGWRPWKNAQQKVG